MVFLASRGSVDAARCPTLHGIVRTTKNALDPNARGARVGMPALN